MNSDIKARLLNHKDYCKIKVRFNDTDMMGIVHFKNFMVYFDDGFVSFMNSLLSPKRIEDTVHEGTAFGVKKVEITYQGSAKFGDYVTVETRIKRIGTSSITFQHEIFRESDKTLIASVECVRLAMELNTNRLLNVADFF
ncbi:MAG: acyl-CoA thioesterase, partial [Promethearchaeota archaeon]